METAAGLETLAAQLHQMANVFAKNVEAIALPTADFERAAEQLNLVSNRVLDELRAARDGAGRRGSG